MKKVYKYGNIFLFREYAGWHADYIDKDVFGKIRCFALHRKACKTKKQAYELAKVQVDRLNKGENNYE